MNVSILIISYNTQALTLACLHSVYEQTEDLDFEVLVVDNASADGSAEAIAARFPQARLILPGKNLGFAAANNLAARQARGEYLLLLNPDTVVLDGAIQRLWAFARGRPDAGVFGGRTLYEDRSLNPTSCWSAPTLWSTACRALGLAHLFPGSRLFDPESMGNWARDSVRVVDIVTGCLLMLRADLWRALGGFDMRFFMYAEDADLCLRARAAGAKCLICPEAAIIHYRGASERVRSDKMVRLLTAKAQLFRKHWNPLAATCGIVLLGIWPLMRVAALWAIRGMKAPWRESYDSWLAIWRRRGEWSRAPKISENAC